MAELEIRGPESPEPRPFGVNVGDEVGRESNRRTPTDPESGGTRHDKADMRSEEDTPTRRRLQIIGVQTTVCRSPGPGVS